MPAVSAARCGLLVTAALLLLHGTAAGATDAPRAAMTKVSDDLARLYERYAASAASSEERVLIDAVASADVNVLKTDLEALGMQDAATFGRIVSGRLPIRAIRALEGLASLHFARAAHATTNPGAAKDR